MGRRPFALRELLGALLLICIGAGAALAADGEPPWAYGATKPSPNAGKTGQYECSTSNPEYKYHVYVPASYSAEKPAGIHIFFHGQGKPGPNPNFWSWKDKFLEPYNLIGINMIYTDGDNSRDTGGKVAAAEQAIGQTVADYKIIVGRGVVSSFSGGGLPHAKLYGARGKGGAPAARLWPFNHTAIYGSNFWTASSGGRPMSWFVGVGTKEWNMGTPVLGDTQPKRAQEVMVECIRKGGIADIYLRIEKDKGHSISEADVTASAELFGRSDIALAPFVYEPDFNEKELAPIAAAANQRQLGQASRAIDALVNRPSLAAPLKDKGVALKRLIDARIDAVIALQKELAAKDPTLSESYARQLVPQLAGHPRLKDIQSALGEAQKNPQYGRHMAAWGVFGERFLGFLGNADVKDDAIPQLIEIRKAAVPGSLLGRMVEEFLGLPTDDRKAKFGLK